MDASESLENLEEMFPQYCMFSNIMQQFKILNNNMLPSQKG